MFNWHTAIVCHTGSWSTKFHQSTWIGHEYPSHPCDSMVRRTQRQNDTANCCYAIPPWATSCRCCRKSRSRITPISLCIRFSLRKAIERAWVNGTFTSETFRFSLGRRRRRPIFHFRRAHFSPVLIPIFLWGRRKMSCTRSHILRQQKSCTSDGASVGLNYRERRFQLQKQFSFDQGQNVRRFVCQRGTSMDIVESKNNFAKIEDELPEASLQVFNAFNAKPHVTSDNETYVMPFRSCKIQLNTSLHNKWCIMARVN